MKTLLKLINGHYRYDIVDTDEHLFVLQDTHKHSIDAVYDIHITASDSVIKLIGMVITSDMMLKKYVIRVHNYGLNNTIDIDIRGLAEHTSTLHIELWGVLENASKASSMRLDAHIKLFDSACGACLPCLSVHTDDVSHASHGATITAFDADIVVYYASRGMDNDTQKELMKQMLVSSYTPLEAL